MNVILDTTRTLEISSGTPAPVQAAKVAAPSRKPVVASSDSGEASPSVPAGYLQANVTFRRDNAGQIYYVLTDPQTGKELRESPPQEVRKVGENIIQFLEQQQQEEAAAHNKHIEVNA